jgi:hypothetical protein
MADSLFGPYIGNPNIARQAIRARELAQQRSAETLPDPRTYGFTQGLLGTSPDQLGMSVLSQNTQPARQAAEAGFAANTALSLAPLMQGIAKGTKLIDNIFSSIENTKALKVAQESNTFTRNSSGYGFGRLMGYPQEKGTPVDKLFSNFADNLKTESAKEQFRENMLKRASSFHPADRSKNNITSSFDFGSYQGILETNPRTGATKILVKDGKETVAAAKLDKGMLDSIAVNNEYKGNEIGKNLLKFIDDSNIGNIYEVPDRSPGFVSIQKKILSEKTPSSPMPVNSSPTNPAYGDPFTDTTR